MKFGILIKFNATLAQFYSIYFREFIFSCGWNNCGKQKELDSQVNTVLARSHGKFQFEINPT